MSVHSVGIAGTGAVARALGCALTAAGVPVTAVAGRTLDRAESLARTIGPNARGMSLSELSRASAHIIIATADDRIGAVASIVAADAAPVVVLHTCGGCGIDVLDPLRAAGAACGVFHPLQTVTADASPSTVFHGVTFAVAGDEVAVRWAGDLARLLGASVMTIPVDLLPAYHAAAVLASNAVAALIDAAVILIERAGVDAAAARRALEPLTRAAVDNVFRLGPEEALTGPVVRGDLSTVRRHLEALSGVPPDVGALYRAVSRSLVSLAARSRLDSRAAAALTSMLEADERLKQ
jgi:predicted short-subunit dehydrogenase-like oxidoreductase (DUF2520 family)